MLKNISLRFLFVGRSRRFRLCGKKTALSRVGRVYYIPLPCRNFTNSSGVPLVKPFFERIRYIRALAIGTIRVFGSRTKARVDRAITVSALSALFRRRISDSVTFASQTAGTFPYGSSLRFFDVLTDLLYRNRFYPCFTPLS